MIKLLFVCTHNRCRSILSEAIARKVLPEQRFAVRSAGSQPAGVVFPGTLDYLTANQYSVEGLMSQSWDDFQDYQPDLVITVCDSAAGEACPVWMGDTAKVHWPLTDPSKEADEALQQAKFTLIGSMIRKRISLLAELLPADLRGAELSRAVDDILNAKDEG